MPPDFSLLHTCPHSNARLGILRTDHGEIPTPVFMPVGTAATVKAVSPRDLHCMQAHIILANTYHLYLRPGTELIAQAGGLHRFMSWPGPILTDSGGFQVWSLKEMRKLRNDGVEFQSHLDGSRHLFTPASVMQAQRNLGADIIMAFDECTPWPCTEAEAQKSLELTCNWTEQALQWLSNNAPVHSYRQLFFGIVQGSMYANLRQKACAHLMNLPVDGYAIGGLSVGEPADIMYNMAEVCAQILPPEKPRYVMGVGTPWNLIELVSRGIDMFDCVMPTRNARNGMLFTSQGVLHYKAGRYARSIDIAPDPQCSCNTCQNHSLGYLRHLHNAGEILGMHLATVHNLHFYLNLMEQMRQAIAEGYFLPWKEEKLRILPQKVS